MSESDRQLAERVRTECVRVALAAYEDAGSSGLCAEGRWEYTIGVLRQLDLEPLLNLASPGGSGPERQESG
jgi:hypothetical protein